MSVARMSLTYPQSGSWRLLVEAEADREIMLAKIFWVGNERPTSEWLIPVSDLKRLIAFAQPNDKQEK